MNVATRPADTRNADALIDGARSLIPALRERSAEAQAARKLPDATIADYKRLELMRCLQPTMFGGYGSDYRVFSKMLRTLAQGCGSSAWVAAVHGEHSWVLGSFPKEAQHDVWDKNPFAVASASVAPNGTAEPVSGGYRLNGRWGFASGCDHAQWIVLGSMSKAASGKTETRMCLLPMDQVEVIDDWHVMGLAGTGSKSIAVKDVIVPEAHTVLMGELKRGTAPGAKVHAGNPLYRMPRNFLAVFSLSSVVVGLAERAVAELVDHTRERRSRGLRVADIEAQQLMVAEAAAKAETAALVGEHTIDRNIRLVEDGAEITAEQVAWTRRNSSYSAQLALSAVKLIFEAAGGTALYMNNPLQEILRDATAAAAHLSLTWHRSAPYYGQSRLGLPIDIDAL
jgi:alkylation response protein AidB-like acyl-CoA dehydrogenase